MGRLRLIEAKVRTVVNSRFAARLRTADGHWLAFSDPAIVLQADAPDAVRRTLDDVEHLTRDRGLHAVGFVTYEAGGAFGLPVRDREPGLPLVWFGLYEPARVCVVPPPEPGGHYELGPISPSIDRAAFTKAFTVIKHHIAEGDTYQVNFTFQLTAGFTGDPDALFADLWEGQRGHYAAFLDLGDTVICSASPELFFTFEGADIIAKPMKGTAARGLTLAADRANAAALHESAKNRAENVMIVDMMRNDIGRIADVGSVTVPELFVVERYPNVWQMTSEVRGRTRAPLADILAALHPPASITGAPKPATMALISELEAAPRGIYTGAIGHVPPDGLARFSVAIRTAVIDRQSGRLSFGVGSGIVWDSDATAEYDECLLKGTMLGRRPVPVELLETMLWTAAEGFVLLEGHMRRLLSSAEYFDVPVSAPQVIAALTETVEQVASPAQQMHDLLPGAIRVETPPVPLRIRLRVKHDGQIHVEAAPLVPEPGPLRVTLAHAPIDPLNALLYHKTTNRAVYDAARAAAPGSDEVLLWNANGEVTEATASNLIVELDGMRVTPPVSCGLLPGTAREDLLARGAVIERVVRVDELRRATGLWLVNSVRGMRPATT